MTDMNPVARFFVNLSAGRRARRRLRWIVAGVSVPAGSRCLELGCGNAAFAVRFVERFRPTAYEATDLDRRQLDAARPTVERAGLAGSGSVLHLETADMLRLPHPDATFDVALAFLTLHHAGRDHHDFDAVRAALVEVSRVLRPGGLLLYEEFLHREAIPTWLRDHGFQIERSERRLRVVRVAARKMPSAGSAA